MSWSGGVFFDISRSRAAMPDASRAPASNEPDVGDVVVTVADVLAAQARLRRYLPPTPMHHAERFGVMLKLENLQRTGSYKVRGALNALLAARERGDRRPVIAASAGNHAQGLAWAAFRLGVQAITVIACTPRRYAAQARPCAWLPAEAAITGRWSPRSRAASIALRAPRTLYEPVRCRFSSLSMTPKRSAWCIGVTGR